MEPAAEKADNHFLNEKGGGEFYDIDTENHQRQGVSLAIMKFNQYELNLFIELIRLGFVSLFMF